MSVLSAKGSDLPSHGDGEAALPSGQVDGGLRSFDRRDVLQQQPKVKCLAEIPELQIVRANLVEDAAGNANRSDGVGRSCRRYESCSRATNAQSHGSIRLRGRSSHSVHMCVFAYLFLPRVCGHGGLYRVPALDR